MASEPVRSIVLDAPGAPGHRTFYLQARLSSGELITILLEKAQAMIIVGQIDTLLEQLRHASPVLPAVPVIAGDVPVLHFPDPVLFRAGQFALQYDPNSGLVCFEVSELRGVGQGEPQFCQWWITRQQISALGEMTRRVIPGTIDHGFAAQME